MAKVGLFGKEVLRLALPRTGCQWLRLDCLAVTYCEQLSISLVSTLTTSITSWKKKRKIIILCDLRSGRILRASGSNVATVLGSIPAYSDRWNLRGEEKAVVKKNEKIPQKSIKNPLEKTVL